MKNLLISAFCSVLAGALAVGCGDNGGKSLQDGSGIMRFPISEVMMTADRNFMGVSEEDTVYLDQYASVLWPVAFGNADLKVLQDSLMMFCFGDSVSETPEQAIERYVNDTSDLDGEYGAGYTAVRIDSLPESIGERGCYFNNVIASVIDLNEELVTYRVMYSFYMGGAHPMTAARPFTYDFESGRVLMLEDILTPEGVDSIVPVIAAALARQFNVPADNLTRAGLFSSQPDFPGYPYISNNTLYFHYNPYEIAPYSSGMIDVAVYPYEIERYLRPEAKALFDLGN